MFGEAIVVMEIDDAIAQVKVGRKDLHDDVPAEPISIPSAQVVSQVPA